VFLILEFDKSSFWEAEEKGSDEDSWQETFSDPKL